MGRKLNFDNAADMMTGFHWEVITGSGVGFGNPVPGTQFDMYPLKSFQVVLSAGIAFGGHRRYWKRRYW